MKENKLSGGIDLPPDFKNVFTSDDIYNIDYCFYKEISSFRNGKKHEAKVYIQKNDTRTTQKFYSDDSEDLRIQVENFVKRMK